jgi:DNA-binding beta-propeller fold protein YncE
VAYDASTGTTLWIHRYGGGSETGSSGAIASSVTVSPNGSKVYVTGGSASDSGNWNYATVAYDAITGANLWAKVRDGPANGYDDALSIAASPDGSRVFVTGESTGSTTGEDYATVAYTA